MNIKGHCLALAEVLVASLFVYFYLTAELKQDNNCCHILYSK